jgi:hypothetical protein
VLRKTVDACRWAASGFMCRPLEDVKIPKEQNRCAMGTVRQSTIREDSIFEGPFWPPGSGMNRKRTTVALWPRSGFASRQRFVTLQRVPTRENSDKASILNESQRFELWAVNLGLYHSGHSSLDYRFRDASRLFEHTLGLLRDLERTLPQRKPCQLAFFCYGSSNRRFIATNRC